MSELVLHGYWRSSAAYRVRIALNLKGLRYTQVTHDLRVGAQRSQDYLALAPHGLVPALADGDKVYLESPAIIEWIDARWPAPRLVPEDPDDAAMVRAMAALIMCDIHPLNNLRVLQALRSDFHASDEQVKSWIARWIHEGFAPLEALTAQHGGRYCYGDTPTLADCCLVPQLYSARRFGVDLSAFPGLVAAGSAAEALDAIEAAHPDRQPDADPA